MKIRVRVRLRGNLRLPTLKTGEGPSMVVSLSSTIRRWKVAKQSSLLRVGVLTRSRAALT